MSHKQDDPFNRTCFFDVTARARMMTKTMTHSLTCSGYLAHDALRARRPSSCTRARPYLQTTARRGRRTVALPVSVAPGTSAEVGSKKSMSLLERRRLQPPGGWDRSIPSSPACALEGFMPNHGVPVFPPKRQSRTPNNTRDSERTIDPADPAKVAPRATCIPPRLGNAGMALSTGEGENTRVARNPSRGHVLVRLARDARAHLDSSGFAPCAVRTYHGHDRGTHCAVSLARVSLPITHTRASPALSVSRAQRCARAEGHLLPGFLSDFGGRLFARGLLSLLGRSHGSALVPTSWARWISHGPCDPDRVTW